MVRACDCKVMSKNGGEPVTHKISAFLRPVRPLSGGPSFAPSLPGAEATDRGKMNRAAAAGGASAQPGLSFKNVLATGSSARVLSCHTCNCFKRLRSVSPSAFGRAGRDCWRAVNRVLPATNCFCRRCSINRWMRRRISISGVNSSARSAGVDTSLIAPISRKTRRPWLMEPLLRCRRCSISAKLSGWGDANTMP